LLSPLVKLAFGLACIILHAEKYVKQILLARVKLCLRRLILLGFTAFIFIVLSGALLVSEFCESQKIFIRHGVLHLLLKFVKSAHKRVLIKESFPAFIYSVGISQIQMPVISKYELQKMTIIKFVYKIINLQNRIYLVKHYMKHHASVPAYQKLQIHFVIVVTYISGGFNSENGIRVIYSVKVKAIAKLRKVFTLAQ
jgi:hypothetical protein